jgi:hypothetical protein
VWEGIKANHLQHADITYLCDAASNYSFIGGSAIKVGAKGGGGAASPGVGTIKQSGDKGGDTNGREAGGGGDGAVSVGGNGGAGGVNTNLRATFKTWSSECTSSQNEIVEAALAHVIAIKRSKPIGVVTCLRSGAASCSRGRISSRILQQTSAKRMPRLCAARSRTAA